MKFNKEELALLAKGDCQHFDKEGALFIREKVEGFFKRNEISAERWCRLRGNLLFYFKSRDLSSDPAGVIVLENVTVKIDNSGIDGTFGVVIYSGNSKIQHLRSYTESERDAWRDAIEAACHLKIRIKLESLRGHLAKRIEAAPKDESIVCDLSIIDPDVPALLECRMSCDSLPNDSFGRPLSVRLVVFVRNCSDSEWLRYANTEIVEGSCNPAFMVSIGFRTEHGINEKTQVKISALYLRERLTMTRINLGNAFVTLEDLQNSEHVRLSMQSTNSGGQAAGFLTVTSWSAEGEKVSSTNSSPSHTAQINEDRSPLADQGHRRCQSLPAAVNHRFQTSRHPFLHTFHSKQSLQNYRFSSRLGGEIFMLELMAEPKIGFSFPKQLLTLWIAEEKELVHEIAGLGELREPWHSCQMSWLENHLNLINTYSIALENLDNYRGPNFKRSSLSADPTYEFVPTNLHLQRSWIENESMRKSGLYDIHTVGAFTAFAQTTESQGLIKMLKQLKSPQNNSSAWCSFSDKLQMAEDSLTAVRKVRREVVECMRLIMKLAKEKVGEGMFPIVEDMLKKTKLICSIPDTVLVEEALLFLEENKITKRPDKDEFSESVSEFMQRNKLKIDFQFRPNVGSLQTPCTEFICKELRTPDTDHLSYNSDPNSSEYWRGYSVYTSGYHSVDRLSDIDEFEEPYKPMTVQEKTKNYYTLFRDGSPTTNKLGTPIRSPKAYQEESFAGSTDELFENTCDPANDSLSVEFDDNDEIEEEVDDDESTPHIVSETSKTQSPSSAGKLSEKDESRQSSNELKDYTDQEEEQENFETEGKSNYEGGHEEPGKEITNNDEETENLQDVEYVEEKLLTEDEINAKQFPNNKIKEESCKQNTDQNSEDSLRNKEGRGDFGIVLENESSPHYRNGDEPEPIDLTYLNIEAAMMCLASKVRSICGKANSPTLSNRTFRFKELDCKKKTRCCHKARLFSNCPDSQLSDAEPESEGFKIPDVPRPSTGSDEIEDWAEEVRPSMRKLRQGMDSLLKTSRMMCSVFRLQQLEEAIKLTHEVKHRRDVCFSQALTSLVSSLMSRLWCNPPDPVFLSVLTQIGPLVCFEGLLSMHGEDVTVYNDMIVAIEDLRSVEFSLVRLEKPGEKNSSSNNTPEKTTSSPKTGSNLTGPMPPLPIVTGSRASLKVMLPLPDWVFDPLPMQYIKNMKFNIIPVFFNIGIDEHATVAEKMGHNGPQEKNNSDNFKILVEYVRKFKQKNFFNHIRHSPNNDEALIDDLMLILKNVVTNKRRKNVEILNLSSQICLKLSGLRFTSCRSGKDLSGMSATLENVNILSREFDLAENEYQAALATLRSEGTRRANSMKNVDNDKYAFRSLQLATFPRQYRPPVGTFGSIRSHW